MRRIRASLAAVLMVCTGISVGCDGSEVDSPMTGWVTFESEAFEDQSISLQLPDSFAGGNLFEPLVIAELETRIAQCPNPELMETMRDGLARMTRSEGVSRVNLLMMLGPFDAEGRCPQVYVVRTDNAYDFTSLEEFLEYEEMVLERSETITLMTIETVTEERAYAEVCIGPADERVAYVFAPPYVYIAYYLPPAEALDASFNSIFRTSAETIVVKDR